MTTDAWARRIRTLLFVPGVRPDRFEKALSSGADGVILDLEDAVPNAGKDEARQHVRPWVEHDGVVVRINDVSSAAFEGDLRMLAGRKAVVMLAKTESPGQVERVRAVLAPGSSVIPLIETASGVLSGLAICAAEGVPRVAVGGVDLATQLNVTEPWSHTLVSAYAHVVIASAAARLSGPIASPSLQIGDREKARAHYATARALGFSGCLCIHPGQVEPAQEAFGFTAADLAWAEKVLEAEESGGATQLDGQMLDKPVFDRARWILASAQAAVSRPVSQKEMHT